MVTVPADGMTADASTAVAELLALRGQPITLRPVGAPVTKPGGGRDFTAPVAPRDPQVFALFNTGKLDGAEAAQTDRSTNRKYQFRMVGAADAVVELGDSWEDDVATYTVEAVEFRAYQVTATVTGYLKAAGHSFGG